MKGAATEPQCFEKAKKLRVLDTQTRPRATNSYADLRDMNMTPPPRWLMSIHHMYTLGLYGHDVHNIQVTHLFWGGVILEDHVSAPYPATNLA